VITVYTCIFYCNTYVDFEFDVSVPNPMWISEQENDSIPVRPRRVHSPTPTTNTQFLMDMGGWSLDQVERALVASNNDVEEAVALLLAQSF